MSSATVWLVPRRDEAYRPFLVSRPEAPGLHPDIDVEVVLSAPTVPAGRQIFDSGTAWSAYVDELGYRLVVRWSGPGGGLTVARCTPDTSRVVAHYTGAGGDSPALGPTAAIDDPVRYPVDQLLLMGHLAVRGGVIVHSAGLVLGGAGLVFPGVSGAGKTTLCRLLAGAGLGDALLSDDRTIVRAEGVGRGDPVEVAGGGAPDGAAAFRLWGTPWHGDAQIARNDSAPLRAVLFLVQADATRVVPIAPAAAARRLFPVVTCPWYDRRLLPAVLDTCGRLVESVPCYELRFRRDREVAGVIERFAAGLA